VVSERLGHASIAITADLYTHVAPSIQKHHIENLARLRTGQVTKEEPTGTISYIKVGLSQVYSKLLKWLFIISSIYKAFYKNYYRKT